MPDFLLYLQKYHEQEFNFFHTCNNQNFATWERLGIPLDLEHLLAGMISSIHNLPHIIVSFPHQEDFTKSPPLVFYPFQLKLQGYYCGLAPELTTDAIRTKLEKLKPAEFINWVLTETNKSAYQDMTFNSWHKNQWDSDKLTQFGLEARFDRIETSKYGDAKIHLNEKIEKPGHASIGLYFNLYKKK